MVNAWMNVARLNFFRESYEGHDHMGCLLRYVSGRSEISIALLLKSPRSQNLGRIISEGQIFFD